MAKSNRKSKVRGLLSILELDMRLSILVMILAELFLFSLLLGGHGGKRGFSGNKKNCSFLGPNYSGFEENLRLLEEIGLLQINDDHFEEKSTLPDENKNYDECVAHFKEHSNQDKRKSNK